MDIMDTSKSSDVTIGEQNDTLNRNISSTKKQLYNAIGDKIPSLKLEDSKFNGKITKTTKPATHWRYSDRIKNHNIYYKQWIKSFSENSSDIDITYKYEKYNHQYKIPYFISNDIFNKAIEKYKEAHIPKLKESMKMKFDKEQELLAAKKEQERTEQKQKQDEKEDDEQKENQHGETVLASSDEQDGEMEVEDVKEPDYDADANKVLNERLRLLTFDNVQQILELAKDYDLKWIIIQDRFIMANRAKKIFLSVPEIKYIFYKSCTIFFQYNNRSEMNALLNFDLEKDLNRQANLERLFNRSAAEVAEEEALILEAKKFEVTSKKIKEERDNIVKLLDYPKAQPNFIPEQFLSASGFSHLYKSLMKMRSSASNHNKFSKFPDNPWKLQFSKFKSQKQKLDPESNNSNNSKYNETINKGNNNDDDEFKLNPILSSLAKRAKDNITQANTKNEIIYELISQLTEFEKDKLHIEVNSKLYTQSGISLNSSKLATNKSSVESKVEKLHRELEIPAKPVMMTTNLIQGYNFLNGVLLECINMKQSIDKIVADEKIKNAKK